MKVRMIFYDISEDGLRTRLHNKLEALGFVRLQYSVFCGKHKDAQWKYCRQEIDQIILGRLGEKDKLNIMIIKPIDLRRMHSLGDRSDIEFILDPPRVLWI